ncbi:MAG: DUF523 domain-containing protein [Methylococcales bacterium]|nr:DUF523 domain-containing protein [Methylococcales bacterium]
MTALPILAISSCLTGQIVRYDGQPKYNSLLINRLKEKLQLQPVCPETAIGLPVPRNKIQLTLDQGKIRVLDTVNPRIDLTLLLQNYAVEFIKQHSISGLVLQEKSPSCGIDNCKVFSTQGALIGVNSGLFAATIIKEKPLLPVCCAIDLQTQDTVSNFIERVQQYHQHHFRLKR